MKNILFAYFLLIICWAGTALTEESPLQLARLEADTEPKQSSVSEVWQALNAKKLKLRSASVLVVDQSGNIVYAKQVNEARPIASITKLMTAMVILDTALDLQEQITITNQDRDLLQLTGSRLKYGATLTREATDPPGVHGIGEPRRQGPCAHLPGRQAGLRRGNEQQGQALGMGRQSLRGPRRTGPRQRRLGQGYGENGSRRPDLPADPGGHHHPQHERTPLQGAR